MIKHLKFYERSNKSSGGFTLVETQISLLIIVIILVAAMSLYITFWRSFNIGNNYMDVYYNSRMAIDKIARDIRWGAGIEQNSKTGSYHTSNSCLIIDVPCIDTSGNIVSPTGGHYDNVIYLLQGNNLHRIVQIDTTVANNGRKNEDRVIAKYCGSLSFSTVDDAGNKTALSSVADLNTVDNIAVFLPLNESMVSLSGGGSKTASLTPTTIIKLRNK